MANRKYNNKTYRQNSQVVKWLANNLCSIPNCISPADQTHHADKCLDNNTLENLVPLCEMHHKIAHKANIDFFYWRISISKRLFWLAQLYKDQSHPRDTKN